MEGWRRHVQVVGSTCETALQQKDLVFKVRNWPLKRLTVSSVAYAQFIHEDLKKVLDEASAVSSIVSHSFQFRRRPTICCFYFESSQLPWVRMSNCVSTTCNEINKPFRVELHPAAPW